jgi:hypothetical protein
MQLNLNQKKTLLSQAEYECILSSYNIISYGFNKQNYIEFNNIIGQPRIGTDIYEKFLSLIGTNNKNYSADGNYLNSFTFLLTENTKDTLSKLGITVNVIVNKSNTVTLEKNPDIGKAFSKNEPKKPQDIEFPKNSYTKQIIAEKEEKSKIETRKNKRTARYTWQFIGNLSKETDPNSGQLFYIIDKMTEESYKFLLSQTLIAFKYATLEELPNNNNEPQLYRFKIPCTNGRPTTFLFGLINNAKASENGEIYLNVPVEQAFIKR